MTFLFDDNLTNRRQHSHALLLLLAVALAGTVFSVITALRIRIAKQELAQAKATSSIDDERVSRLESKVQELNAELRLSETRQKAGEKRIAQLTTERSLLADQVRESLTSHAPQQESVRQPKIPVQPPVFKDFQPDAVISQRTKDDREDPKHLEEYKQLAEARAVYTYPAPPSRPKLEVIPGYYKRIASGFTLIVSRETYDQSDKLDGQPLGCLEAELQLVASLLPELTAKALAKVPIWIEWDHITPGNSEVLAVYFGFGSESLGIRGIDSRKTKCVCVQTLRRIFLLKSRDKKSQTILLHELAHAVHDQFLGDDNSLVNNAYEQATTRKLYTKVEHLIGPKKTGYAATNHAEYFAELSCCYLDKIDYYPYKASELRDYDSPGYELMAGVWGTPEQIAKAKSADAERRAKYKKK